MDLAPLNQGFRKHIYEFSGTDGTTESLWLLFSFEAAMSHQTIKLHEALDSSSPNIAKTKGDILKRSHNPP